MAGDWIKMRGNLWDDPRVAALCDATGEGEAAVIGGLYWLWATADQHTEDGHMPGLTLRQIDRKTGIKGFGAALVSVGWLADGAAGVSLVKFDEHNGASAKRRASDAQRKAAVRSVSASDADKPPTSAGQADDEKRRFEELEKEKRREEEEKRARIEREAAELARAELEAQGFKPSQAGLVCKAMRQAGMPDANPGDPRLLALIEQGCTVEEFAGIAAEAAKKSKGWAWALKAIEGRRTEAAAIALPPENPTAWTETRSGIVAKGKELGLGNWDEYAASVGRGERFDQYSARVMKAAGIVKEAA